METGASDCNLALEAARQGPFSAAFLERLPLVLCNTAFPGFLAAEPGADMEAPITRPADASNQASTMAEDAASARPDCRQSGYVRLGLSKTVSLADSIWRWVQGPWEDQID